MNPTTPQLPLEDIILPAAPGIWPLAPGWWLLLALMLALMLVLIAATFLLLRRRKRLQTLSLPYRHITIRLNDVQTQHKRLSPDMIQDINTQLKIWCRHRYPQAVNLYGKDWAVFLANTNNSFSKDELRLLGTGAYVPEGRFDGDAGQLFAAVTQWLEQSEKHWRRSNA